MIWLHRCLSYYSLRRNEHENRRWKSEPIERISSGRSWYTQPGRMMRFARHLEPLSAVAVFDAESITEVKCAFYEAQEFKTIRYQWERKDYFNRKSGRYMHSEVSYAFQDGRTEHRFEVRDDVKDLEGIGLLEEQR